MKIIDNYLEVTEPEIASVFLREKVKAGKSGVGKIGILVGIDFNSETEKPCFTILCEDGVYYCETIRIPKETVKKVCEAKGKDYVFNFNDNYSDNDIPEYIQVAPFYTDSAHPKANTLTIGKTVGELRELVKWMEV